MRAGYPWRGPSRSEAMPRSPTGRANRPSPNASRHGRRLPRRGRRPCVISQGVNPVRPSDVSKALAALVPTKRPVYLWGPPGCAKSAVVRQTAATLGLTLADVRATLLDPVDLRGLPRLDGDAAVWCPPAFLPKDGQGLLFLDELAQAAPLVQAACLQLVLDRRIGEYELPDGWVVVAASNRAEDRAGAHRLITPLLNRFVHLELEVSHD